MWMAVIRAFFRCRRTPKHQASRGRLTDLPSCLPDAAHATTTPIAPLPLTGPQLRSNTRICSSSRSTVPRCANSSTTRVQSLRPRMVTRWLNDRPIEVRVSARQEPPLVLRRDKLPQYQHDRVRGCSVPRQAVLAEVLAAPVWSPDGERIAFWDEGFDEGGTFVMDSDGSHLAKVTDGRLRGWSPDSEWLLFASPNGCCEMWMV